MKRIDSPNLNWILVIIDGNLNEIFLFCFKSKTINSIKSAKVDELLQKKVRVILFW